MRNLALIAMVLALLLVLAGCPTPTPPDTGTAPPAGDVADTGETTEATDQPPAEPEEAPAVETHPTAKIAVLKVGDEFDEAKEEITNQTKTFSPDTPVIYVSAGITGLTEGEMVTGRLTAVNVTDKAGTEIRDVEVASTELEAPGEESTMQFKFSAPTQGWPVGSYKLEIEGTGKLIETIEVTVEEGA